jgi:DNA polymerase I-like protein with 3'-5' exonuclease and polymerase domains
VEHSSVIVDFGLLTDLSKIEAVFKKLAAIEDGFGFDIETGYSGPPMEKYALHPETSFVVGVSFSGHPTWARYVPLRHDVGNNVDNVAFARLLAVLLATGKGVPHNGLFELRHLASFFRKYLTADEIREFGLDKDGYYPIRSDSMVEGYSLGKFREHGLKPMTLNVFDHKMTEFSDLFPDATSKQTKSQRFNILELSPKVISYACEDSACALALHRLHYPLVKDRLMYKVDMQIIPILGRMEDRGIAMDWATMARWDQRAIQFNEALRSEIMHDLSLLCEEPVDINLGSAPQVGGVLYQKLGLRTTKLTEKGEMSTDAKALSGLAKKHPVVQKILNWRELRKLSGSYLTKYPRDFRYAEDGRGHPSHQSTAVVSGRFAVSDPAYQQLPKKYRYVLDNGTVFELKFRDIVMAETKHYLIGFDYSQVELRVLAGLSGEPALVKAFNNNDDVHQMTAALMFGIPFEQVTEEQRSTGKAQPIDEPVLTPFGWRPIGDLKVGDQVIGSSGKATTVTGVFPQGVREVFKVTTTDGAETRCCAEHLWTVTNLNGGRTMTRPLADGPKSLVSMGLENPNGQAKFKLPERPVVHYAPGPELPIDPYVLGLLLGDGGFCHDWAVSFASADPELIDAVSAEHVRLGGLVKFATTSTPEFQQIYLVSAEHGAPNPLSGYLRDLGIRKHRDSEKFIPELYMRAAPEDRLAVLQGLMDTDGSVSASGGCLRVTSRALVEQSQELVRSLGGRSSFDGMPLGEPSVLKSGRVITPRQIQYRTQMRLSPELIPFRLPRKIAKLKTVKYKTSVSIRSAESVGETETVCIAVSAADNLYLTNGCIVTHNTINFSLLYGQGPKGMAERMGIDIELAKAFLQKYFAVYSSIKSWVDKQTKEGVARGRTMSKFGRIHPIWALESDKPAIRANGERLCVNAPVQGGAADIMRIAMIRCTKALRQMGLDDRVHLIMNIHDALVFEVDVSVHPQTVIDVVQPEVVFPIEGWPALRADWEIGLRWGSMTKLKLDENDQIVVPAKTPASEPELLEVG